LSIIQTAINFILKFYTSIGFKQWCFSFGGIFFENILKMAILLPHPLQPTCVQRRRRFSLHRRRFSPHRRRWGIYSPNRWCLPFLYTSVDELVALASGRLPSHDDKLPETMAAHKAKNDYFCNSPETFSRDENLNVKLEEEKTISGVKAKKYAVHPYRGDNFLLS